jgi:hypothetical protein
MRSIMARWTLAAALLCAGVLGAGAARTTGLGHHPRGLRAPAARAARSAPPTLRLRGGVEFEEIVDDDTAAGEGMDAAALGALRTAVEQLTRDPSLLHTSELAFFRDYLASMGATLPRAAREPTSSKPFRCPLRAARARTRAKPRDAAQFRARVSRASTHARARRERNAK